jgi:phage terminase large subunit
LAATNPTGVGLQWVKSLWIDRKFSPELRILEHEFTFVQAKLEHNPHIGESYRIGLSALPEKKRRALLEGDWNIPEGQYFINFVPSDRRVRDEVIWQIVKPWWSHRIGQDWGYNHHSPVYWHCVGNVTPEQATLLGRNWFETRRCVFTYREHIESLSLSGRSEIELGRSIRIRSEGENIGKWILSSDAFAKKTTQNTPAMLLSEGAGSGRVFPHPVPADMRPGTRSSGWRFMYQLIQNDEWFISERCSELLDAIPGLEYDVNKGGEDILKTDHLYDDIGDCVRYSLVDMLSNARKPREVEMMEKLESSSSPLSRHFMKLAETERRAKERQPKNYWEV